MVKRILIFFFIAASAFGQDSDWIFRHPDMVKDSPWWTATVSAPWLLWLKWGDVEIKYPPEISSISGPGCMFTYQDSKTEFPIIAHQDQTRATLRVLRGHPVQVKCRGKMLKSQAEMLQEFPLTKAKPWCHEAPCIDSIYINGRD
jgi:hypothetical protein